MLLICFGVRREYVTAFSLFIIGTLSLSSSFLPSSPSSSVSGIWSSSSSLSSQAFKLLGTRVAALTADVSEGRVGEAKVAVALDALNEGELGTMESSGLKVTPFAAEGSANLIGEEEEEAAWRLGVLDDDEEPVPMDRLLLISSLLWRLK